MSSFLFWRPTVSVTRWWAGVDETHYTEKCSGVEKALFRAANPTSRVHAVLGRQPFIETNNGLLLGTLAGYFINEFRCDKP